MKTLAQIVEERLELDDKWVAMVLEKRLLPPPLPAGTSSERIYASDAAGDPLTGFEVLCGVDFRMDHVGERELNGVRVSWCLITADQPFVVRWYEYDGAPTNIKVIKARQVSSGELSRFPEVPMPRFTRGAMGWSWVRLTTLARFLRLPAKKVWDDYYEIGRDAILDRGRKVCIDGCGKDRLVVRVNYDREGDMSEMFAEELYEHRRIWVPAGWAADVCYLVHFRRLNDRRIAHLSQERGAVAP